MASAILDDKFRIEIDGYPDTATPRPVQAGRLPPGLSMVSFRVDSVDDLPVAALRSSKNLSSLPNRRGPAALVRGPDDELLELVVARD